MTYFSKYPLVPAETQYGCRNWEPCSSLTHLSTILVLHSFSLSNPIRGLAIRFSISEYSLVPSFLRQSSWRTLTERNSIPLSGSPFYSLWCCLALWLLSLSVRTFLPCSSLQPFPNSQSPKSKSSPRICSSPKAALYTH